MRRHITLLAALALAVSLGCATGATGGHGRMGSVSPGQFRTVPATYDPSVSGYPGAVGDIIQNAGSLSAWVRTGPNITDWQAFPGGGSGVSVSARGVAASAITLSGTQTVDGVALVAGDRELVTAQADATTDGLYLVAAGAWTRTTDTLTSGMLVAVTSGNVYIGTVWQLTTQAPITVSSTALTFVSTGNAAFGWDATQVARAKALLGTQITQCQFSDLLNTNEYVELNAGLVTTAQLAGSTGGVVRLGVSATGYLFPAGMRNDNPPSSAPSVVPFANQQTTAFYIASRVRIPSTPSAGSHFYDLIDTSGTTSGIGVGLRINGNVSTTVLQLFQTSTNTAANSAGTFGSGIAFNTFFDAAIGWDVANTKMTGQINGATAVTVSGTTNIPTEPAVVDINTNVVGGLDVDKMMWCWGDML